MGSPWNISQTKIAPYAACMVKIGIQMNNAVYTSKDKNYLFSSIKKNFCYKTWSPIAFFLLEYSVMGIVKPKFTRINEIWCRILEIEDLSKNVRKTRDRTSLRAENEFHSTSKCYRKIEASLILGQKMSSPTSLI